MEELGKYTPLIGPLNFPSPHDCINKCLIAFFLPNWCYGVGGIVFDPIACGWVGGGVCGVFEDIRNGITWGGVVDYTKKIITRGEGVVAAKKYFIRVCGGGRRGPQILNCKMKVW